MTLVPRGAAGTARAAEIAASTIDPAGTPARTETAGTGATTEQAGRDGQLRTVRVGVLLTVPEPLGACLSRWREVFLDPLADAVPPHVTLLPPLAVPAGSLPAVEAHLSRIAASELAFAVTLCGAGTFRPVSPVVFLALDDGAGDCARLQDRIRSGPLASELAFPFHPHVTVAHGVDDAVLDDAADSLCGLRAHFAARYLDAYLDAGADGTHRWLPWRRFALVAAGPPAGSPAGPPARPGCA